MPDAQPAPAVRAVWFTEPEHAVGSMPLAFARIAALLSRGKIVTAPLAIHSSTPQREHGHA